MRLALRVGRLDVDRLMRELGARQLAEWEQFLVLELNPPPRMVSEAEFRKQFGARVRPKKKR